MRRAPAPTVTRRRRIAAPLDVVWGHVVGAGWLGLPSDGDEPTAGNRVRLRDPFGDGPRDANVVAVEPAGRLALEWWPAGRPDDRSHVEIGLRADGAQTVVTVVETAVPAAVTVRGRAWTSCLQALAGAVDRARSPFALSER